jgi:hypothetical protein
MGMLLLLATALLVFGWLFTLYRIHTGEFSGRYTKRRWFVSALNFWGVLAYWTVGDSQRLAKNSGSK